jgi:hypothetical protein
MIVSFLDDFESTLGDRVIVRRQHELIFALDREEARLNPPPHLQLPERIIEPDIEGPPVNLFEGITSRDGQFQQRFAHSIRERREDGKGQRARRKRFNGNLLKAVRQRDVSRLLLDDHQSAQKEPNGIRTLNGWHEMLRE